MTFTIARSKQLAESYVLDKNELTSRSPRAIIRPSSRGTSMAVPPPVLTILALTADGEIQAQLKHALRDASITVVRDAAAFQREASKHSFDAVVIESRGGLERSLALPVSVDPSRTLVIAGSRAVLKKAAKTFQFLDRHHAHSSGSHSGKHRDDSLQGYLETKMGDFVRSMRNGSAKNLYPVLISAIERPLIASALQETQGNQIQAAELLGLNRNTLRKKILDLHIPLKHTRRKTRQTR
jgi:two-component system nitrogen regulation response regulator GlnG